MELTLKTVLTPKNILYFVFLKDENVKVSIRAINVTNTASIRHTLKSINTIFTHERSLLNVDDYILNEITVSKPNSELELSSVLVNKLREIEYEKPELFI